MTQILMCRDKMNINTILLPLPLFFIKVWTLLSAWHNRGGALLLPPPQVILELLNPLNFKSDTRYSKEKLAWIPVFLSLFFRLEFLYEVSIVGNVSYVEDDKIIYKWDWWRISCIWSVLKHFPSGEDPLSWSASDGREEILYPLTNNRAIYLKLIHTQTRWYSPLRRNEQYLIRRRYIVS